LALAGLMLGWAAVVILGIILMVGLAMPAGMRGTMP
jgi:hypothetical protein